MRRMRTRSNGIAPRQRRENNESQFKAPMIHFGMRSFGRRACAATWTVATPFSARCILFLLSAVAPGDFGALHSLLENYRAPTSGPRDGRRGRERSPKLLLLLPLLLLPLLLLPLLLLPLLLLPLLLLPLLLLLQNDCLSSPPPLRP
jgi:hypothetical protein